MQAVLLSCLGMQCWDCSAERYAQQWHGAMQVCSSGKEKCLLVRYAASSSWLLLCLLLCLLLLAMTRTQSSAFSRFMSDTDSVGISTLMRLMLPQGSVLTFLITSRACGPTAVNTQRCPAQICQPRLNMPYHRQELTGKLPGYVQPTGYSAVHRNRCAS